MAACTVAEEAAFACANSAQRAGPALPSYLALHHAGFSVPPVLPLERWALTPPFHPCQAELAFRRRLAGFPVRCHRAPLRRRSILCGTFRDAVIAPGFIPASPTSSPGVTRRVAHSVTGPCGPTTVVSGLSSRFGRCSGGSTPPFFGFSQRSPGSPASLIISRFAVCRASFR